MKSAMLFILVILFNEIFSCGQLQNTLIPLLANGEITHRWPWHSAVYHQGGEFKWTYKCGGTLIGPNEILTAAHCVLRDTQEIQVSLGRLLLDENSAPYHKVAEVIPHPDYSYDYQQHDIAIIVLETSAVFDSYVQPVCLWSADKTDISEIVGKHGTVVGWGLTETGEVSNALRQTSLPVVDFFTCLESYRGLFGRFLSRTNFCAGNRNGTSVCTGDSGGSMTFEMNGKFYIRGIVSVGASKEIPQTKEVVCDPMQYAIFTDVAQYLPWIRRSTKAVECNITVSSDCMCVNFLFKYLTTNQCVGPYSIHKFHSMFTLNRHILKITWKNAHGRLYTKVRSKCYCDKNGIHTQCYEAPFTAICTTNWVDHSCFVVLYINTTTADCRFIFDQIPYAEVTGLIIRGKSDVIPEVSDAAMKFEKLAVVSFFGISLKIVHRGRLTPFGNIKQLDLSYNNIDRFDAADTFDDLTNLMHLNIVFNKLTELYPNQFKELVNLALLYLGNNHLTTLPSNLFHSNGKLQQLDLSANQLKELHANQFTELHNIDTILLSNNQLETIPLGLFRNNAKLTHLDLSYNIIRKIEPDFNQLKRDEMKYIFLKGNICIYEQCGDYDACNKSKIFDEIQRNC